MKTLGAVFLLAIASSSASAQAPRITPAGDPSVKADTLYRLAVDSAKYPKDDYVFLLDDGVIRFEADGRSSRTYRQIVQILRPQAAERWGEHAFGYDRSSEKLTLNWARVVKLDGTVLSDSPTHQQESATGVAMSAPVYSDSRVLRLTLGAVAPGTIVDFSYTTEVVTPRLRGDFSTDWSVTNSVPTVRSRLVVELPDSISPRLFERNLDFAKSVVVKGGRRTYTWATANVEERPRESYATFADSADMGVSVAAPLSWDSIGHWYAGVVKDRFALSPEVVKEFGTVVSAAKNQEDSLRALHKWVARDFRYVSLSLGEGGYRPRLPAEVIQTRYGDCKDKAVLFIALARRMGVRAYPVLLSLYATADKARPSLAQFDHMIAAVDRGGKLMYVDLTSEDTPWGEIPDPEHGGFALVVRGDRDLLQVNLPEDSVATRRIAAAFAGRLSEDGELRLRATITGGPAEQFARAMATARVDAQARAEAAQAFATGMFPEAIGDSLDVVASDSATPARIAVTIIVPHAASSAGNNQILTVPFRPVAAQSIVTALQSHLPRHYWIDVPQLVAAGTQVTTFDVELPPGWTAELPTGLRVETDFAKYISEYSQEGSHLRLSRRTSGTGNPVSPARLNEVTDWIRRVAKDDTRFIVLKKPA